MKSPQEQLAELEDSFILGEILESDYQEQKRALITQLRNRGETIQRGNIQIAEGKDTLGVPFCYVPAGPFFFGPDDLWKDLQCSFYISKYPVTVELFQQFLAESDIDYSEDDLYTLQLVSPEPDCPASHLSYNDAKEFCRWLRRVTNEYYSLPHEVEWEKAARGEDGRFYPWGNEPPNSSYAGYQGEIQYACTVPIDTFEDHNVSPYGCVDMVGNVWEWCLDSFNDERDPHILRGGSWCNEVDYSNCLARTFSYPPDKRIDYGGFRLVYLPHDMLVEYRRAYADFGNATKAGLRVVSISKGAEAEKKMSPSKSLSALTKALDSAAAAAAGHDKKAGDTTTNAPAVQVPPEAPGGGLDEEMQDALAKAISSAASQFLRKDQNADRGFEIERPTAPEPTPARQEPKYRAIAELRAEREGKKKDKDADEPKGNAQIEFEEDSDLLNYSRATAAEIPAGVTMFTFVIWLILLIGVVGLTAYRLTTF